MHTVLIIALIVFAVWLTIGAVGVPFRVGKPRAAFTPGLATASLIISAILIATLVWAAVTIAH